MKKMLLLLFVLLNVASFANGYKDGVYYVAADKDSFGWKPFTQITIKNGKITDVITDRINKKNELASKDASYNKSMKKSTKTNPSEYSVNIPKNFLNANGNIEKMDAVAGATDSLREFKIMTKFLLEKATTGEPGKYVIPKSKLK